MSTTYTAARLYTGLHEDIIADGAVTIDGEQIIYAGPAGQAPTATDCVDLGDLTLMPGLIDTHVHLTLSASNTVLDDYMNDGDGILIARGVEAARRLLHAGVTTARECGGRNEHVFALRAASQRRIIPAPRIIAAGASITCTGGHCWFFGLEADSEDDVRRAVRRQVKAGADYIKVMATGGGLTPRTNTAEPQYTLAQMQALVEEATRMGGLAVAAHCHGTPGIRNAAQAGVTTIEHCSFIVPGDIVYDAEVAALVRDAGCYVCPTIGIGHRAFLATSPEEQARHPFFRLLPKRYESLRQLKALGVPFISGSDAGVNRTPFEDFVFNLTLLVDKVGFTAHEAIATATITAAAALRRPDLGALAAGKAADMIAVRGNPLEDVHALWDVACVVARGTRYR